MTEPEYRTALAGPYRAAEVSLRRVLVGIQRLIRAGELTDRHLIDRHPEDHRAIARITQEQRYVLRQAYHEAWEERKGLTR